MESREEFNRRVADPASRRMWEGLYPPPDRRVPWAFAAALAATGAWGWFVWTYLTPR